MIDLSQTWSYLDASQDTELVMNCDGHSRGGLVARFPILCTIPDLQYSICPIWPHWVNSRIPFLHCRYQLSVCSSDSTASRRTFFEVHHWYCTNNCQRLQQYHTTSFGKEQRCLVQTVLKPTKSSRAVSHVYHLTLRAHSTCPACPTPTSLYKKSSFKITTAWHFDIREFGFCSNYWFPAVLELSVHTWSLSTFSYFILPWMP